MKILFYGDSITDALRKRDEQRTNYGLGTGYPLQIAGRLSLPDPDRYEFINTGVSGDRIVDLYARVKNAVWNYEPDVLSILIGVNDVWHEIFHQNGVDIVRFEKVYRMLLDDTIARLPKIKLILMEPFVTEGEVTRERYGEFLAVKEYAKVVRRIAEDYHAAFVPLQEKIDELSAKCDPALVLRDGVHPNYAGCALIAEEWIKVFRRIEA